MQGHNTVIKYLISKVEGGDTRVILDELISRVEYHSNCLAE